LPPDTFLGLRASNRSIPKYFAAGDRPSAADFCPDYAGGVYGLSSRPLAIFGPLERRGRENVLPQIIVKLGGWMLFCS